MLSKVWKCLVTLTYACVSVWRSVVCFACLTPGVSGPACLSVWICVSECETMWVLGSPCESLWVPVSPCEVLWAPVSPCESMWIFVMNPCVWPSDFLCVFVCQSFCCLFRLVNPSRHWSRLLVCLSSPVWHLAPVVSPACQCESVWMSVRPCESM